MTTKAHQKKRDHVVQLEQQLADARRIGDRETEREIQQTLREVRDDLRKYEEGRA